MKFQAPKHVTGIMAAGEVVNADENGVADVADDAPVALVNAMKAEGWTLVDVGGEAPPVLVKGKVKPADEPLTLEAADEQPKSDA